MRALFSCIPSEGHFRPLLPLAHALAAVGHDVAFATAEDWHPRVADEGFDALAAGASRAELAEPLGRVSESVRDLPPGERRPVAFSGIFARTHAPAKLSDLLDAAGAWQADAIVYDSGDLAAPLVAALLDLPSVHHAFGAMIPLPALERAAAEIEPLWRSQGVPPEPYAGVFRGLYVDICPPTLEREQPPGDRVLMQPAGIEPVEPPAWLRRLPPPLVYVTLGTIFNDAALFRPLLAALDGELSAIVTTGRDLDPAAVGSVSPRVRVERFVPQAQVLASCAAVVTHGGSGTTLGALANGLPLVFVPQGADQFDNAARCAAAGAALVVMPGEQSAEAVRAALGRVLEEPRFASAARALASEIASMPAPDEVARAVEAHVARR